MPVKAAARNLEQILQTPIVGKIKRDINNDACYNNAGQLKEYDNILVQYVTTSVYGIADHQIMIIATIKLLGLKQPLKVLRKY